MIHDKDYMMRQVKQFSEFLSKMLLGKNEGKPEEEQLVFDTQLRGIFRKTFDQLASAPLEELSLWVEQQEEGNRPAYYELLGTVFYFKYKEIPNPDFAEKARHFYRLWQEKGRVFSLLVVQRLNELS
ncbi:hypothetical protein [Bergeyella sp. RCAD1439]|uniref:hypothetical protein n=1 Tax=Bergeyella anatis TaxID=3113737 RepID=UPI002E171C01|nr:hypothetical protein [Bergeyella sp. RCAD1439]